MATDQTKHKRTEATATCPRCHDRGFYLLIASPDDDGAGQLVRCACKADEDRARLYQRQLAASNLTPLLQRKTFATFDAQRDPVAHDTLFAFAANPEGWLVLASDPGAGKTHLLAAVANALLAAGRQPLYVVAPDLLAYIRSGMNGTHDVEDRIQQAIQADVLLLDDLGAESETRWTREQFFRVINGRYNTLAPTVIATNCELTELDERIASRLGDRALVTPVILDCDDYRVSDAQAAKRRGWAAHHG